MHQIYRNKIVAFLYYIEDTNEIREDFKYVFKI
jgi:hypothetical protein